jgi:tetratricopeptide (TPR) repeat protein
MRWVQFEYALKGLFLGLLLYTALQTQLPPPLPEGATRGGDEVTQQAWEKTGHVALYMLAGLGAGLALGLLRQLGDLARILRKPHAFLVFLLLENPLLIYLGLVGGLALGAGREFDPGDGRPNLILLSIGGAILGYGFGQLRDFKDFRYRFGLSVAVGAGVVYSLVMYLEKFHGGEFLTNPDMRQLLGFQMLLGLPFFYLLCFVGIAEESEAEIAGLCTMLGFAIYLLKFPSNMPAAGFLLPVALYFTYVVYVLPGLRVFKHTLRGFIYLQVGKLKPSLLAFRRALQLDPGNHLAHQGMDFLHANIEIEKVDAAVLGLLDPNRCLNRVRKLLAQQPAGEELKKAHHLLNLVEKLWPKLTSHVVYYRAVAAAHAKDLDKASELLTDLLNPEGWFPDDAARKTILFDAWQLVLLVHPVLRQRVGEPQLALPGRRVEAIGAVERQLAIQPGEATVLDFRQALYGGLQEREYFEAAKDGPPADFSHRYAEEIGTSLIGDPERWQRGAQYLRVAANGQPLRRPGIFKTLSEAYAKAGETLQATKYLQYVRDCAREVGVENLPDDQRTIYFATVRRLADEAAARGDIDEAIYDYSLATHAPDSGAATLRSLAEMYQRKHDIMNALRITEKGLCHDGRDADLLEKKAMYYRSVEPHDLAKAAKEDDNVRKFFDVRYCVREAKGVLDRRETDLEWLEYATHLVDLALVMQPQNLIALVQKARLHLRRGERMEGVQILEDVKEMKPSGTEETDAWFFVHKQLGKIYLDELSRPDLAIPCFVEYLNHVGSGAETLYDLGRAYEANGDRVNAIRSYNQVTAYEGHPLVWDAQQAIRRLKENATV